MNNGACADGTTPTVRTRMARLGVCPLIALTVMICPAALFAQPPRISETRTRVTDATPFRTKTASSATASQLIPYNALSPALREKVRRVVTQPTLATGAPLEEVSASPKTYEWLLDHPDRAALAWRRMGVQCAPIKDLGQGR